MLFNTTSCQCQGWQKRNLSLLSVFLLVKNWGRVGDASNTVLCAQIPECTEHFCMWITVSCTLLLLILLLLLFVFLSHCCFQPIALISTDDLDLLCLQLEQGQVAVDRGFSGRTGEHHSYTTTEGASAKWVNATELSSLKRWRCNWAQWQEWCSITILNATE